MSSDSTVTVTPNDPAPRSRRMGLQFTNPAPGYHAERTLNTPPRSPVGASSFVSDFDENDFEPCTPPQLPTTPSSPTPSIISTQSSPPVPPRSPLRGSSKSVASFTTILASYQDRDDTDICNDQDSTNGTMTTSFRMAAVPNYERMMSSTSRATRNRSGSVASMSALLDSYALNMGAPPSLASTSTSMSDAHSTTTSASSSYLLSGAHSISTSNAALASGPRSLSITRLRTSSSGTYDREGSYSLSGDKPLPSTPSDDSSFPTPTSLGHDMDPLAAASSTPSGPPGERARSEPAVSKRTHALLELLSSERAYASDLAFVRDTHIPLALGEPISFTYSSFPGAASPSSSGSSARTLSTHSGSSSGSTQASSIMMSTSVSTGSSASGVVKGVVSHGPPPMTKDDVKTVFGNIRDLALFADWFSDRLQAALGDAVEDGQGEDYVGKLFLEMIPRMEPMYKAYITRQPQASAHLISLPKTPALLAYFDQAQKLASSVTHAWDLGSLLIKPVQRLLKYPLILATIIENTPEGHGDRQNLILARERLEAVAHNVNEGRRRIEIVKEVLSKKGDTPNSTPLKKKVSLGKSASTTLTLNRVKSMGVGLRGPRNDLDNDANSELSEVERLEKRLKDSEAFIRDLAKDVKDWATSVGQTIILLHQWAQHFGKVIGLTNETPSEAFDAFLDLINFRLGPLTEALDDLTSKMFLPQLGKLLESARMPTRVLNAMHQYEPSHSALLNFNFSKSRPSQTMLEASQNYLALRGQLVAELPIYLSHLDRGIVTFIKHLTLRQTEFWSCMRDHWSALWDCLRMEGETNAGCEETLRLWWSRYSEMEEAVSKLQILKRERSFSNIPRSQTSNNSQSPRHRYNATQTASPSKHRSFGSLDTIVAHQGMARSPSSESLPVRHLGSKSRWDTPEPSNRAKSRSNTAPIIPMASSSSPSINIYASTSTQGSSYRDRDADSVHSGDRRRKSRSPSFSRKISDSLMAPLRRTPSDKSLRPSSPYSTSARGGDDFIPPVPNIVSHLNSNSPNLYPVVVTYPYIAPAGATYLSLPFLDLQESQILFVVYEAGPSHQHELPRHVIDDDDDSNCLLITRDENENVGWIFSSYVEYLDSY